MPIQGKVNEEGSAEETKTKELTVPANTPLAFSVYELSINKDTGTFSLVIDPAKRGGFIPKLNADDIDGHSSKTHSG